MIQQKEVNSDATRIENEDFTLNQARTVATDFTSLSIGPDHKNEEYPVCKLSPTKKDDRKLFVGGIARNCKCFQNDCMLTIFAK